MSKEAGQCESPYSVLYHEDFQKKYHIKTFEELRADYFGSREEEEYDVWPDINLEE